eukprot:6331884-Amphidinium_carterae.1
MEGTEDAEGSVCFTSVCVCATGASSVVGQSTGIDVDDLPMCVDLAWQTATAMGETLLDGGSWMLCTHVPRKHKQLLATPSIKCLTYRASIGVTESGEWHAWLDVWPSLGHRKRTETVHGVVIFSLLTDEAQEREQILSLLQGSRLELQHLWMMT